MIFINHITGSTAAKEYYSQHISPGDYYGKDAAEMKGVWHGKGATMLSLDGEVKQADFFKLCDNINPSTGGQLTPRTKDDRRVLTDVTFDVPKSVTLAFEMGGHNGGGDTRILNAVQASVRETMADIEKEVQTRVRKGRNDTDRLTGNMIWAEHVHRTTRPVEGIPDPQLHIHATILNATFDETEKRWKAIQLGDIVRDKGYYQAAFHARLASKLKDLGYGIHKDGTSFSIAGIDRATIDKFSRRSDVIEKEAERLGVADAESKGKLGKRTREQKGKDRPGMPELRAEWENRLTPEERLAIRTAGSGFKPGDAAITPAKAKEYALEHSFQNASAVSEKRLRAEALTYAVGSIKPEDVADISRHPEAIPVRHDGQLFVTTKTMLNSEISFLQFAKDGQRKHQPFIPAREHFAGKQLNPLEYSRSGTFTESLAGLSEEQQKAVLHVLNSRDTVTGIVGKAGTGKTTTMRSTRDVLEAETGMHVFAFAQSSQASRNVLAKEGFKDATTLETLLRSTKVQEQVKGKIIWVDEAGQVSSRDMKRLMGVVKATNSRLILSGDYTQHSSVEAGDSFRLLEKEAGVKLARLTEIHRQRMPGYKKAVEAISKGSGKEAQKGFDALDKMGWVVEAHGDERHQKLVIDYLKSHDEGKSALIIAPTHSESNKLTDELRGALKRRGALGDEREFVTRRSTGWSDAQKGDSRNYEPGMVIDFNEAIAGMRKQIKGTRTTEGGFAKGEAVVVVGRQENAAVAGQSRDNYALERLERRGSEALAVRERDGIVVLRKDGSRAILPMAQAERFTASRTREIGVAKGDRIRITKNGEAKVAGQAKGTKVNNGDIFTVEGFTKEGDIRLGNGKLLPKGWGHFSLGYVDTSYASQGKTVDRVFIATGKESLPAANQQQWYVSASRGREMAKVYVDSKEDVRNAIARTGQRLSAVELTHTKLASTWRARVQQSLERNRVGRFLAQRASAISDYLRERQKGMRYA
jgi:conjugative relaxase-like TrwC/TraI family protein